MGDEYRRGVWHVNINVRHWIWDVHTFEFVTKLVVKKLSQFGHDPNSLNLDWEEALSDGVVNLECLTGEQYKYLLDAAKLCLQDSRVGLIRSLFRTKSCISAYRLPLEDLVDVLNQDGRSK